MNQVLSTVMDIGLWYRYKILVPKLLPFFSDSRKFLDIGASNGRMSKRISKKLDNLAVGTDVHVMDNAIPMVRYNGNILPFKHNSFDSILLSDVLHHCKEQKPILLESIRVSSKYIVVKDHYYESRIDRLGLGFMDFICNKPFGIDVTYNFNSLEQWYELFSSLGLRIIDQVQFKFFSANPCKEVIFKLEVPS